MVRLGTLGGVFSGVSVGCCVGGEEPSTNMMCLSPLAVWDPRAFLKPAVLWREFVLQCPRHGLAGQTSRHSDMLRLDLGCLRSQEA